MDLYINPEQDKCPGAVGVPGLLFDPYMGWGYYFLSDRNPRFEESDEDMSKQSE